MRGGEKAEITCASGRGAAVQVVAGLKWADSYLAVVLCEHALALCNHVGLLVDTHTGCNGPCEPASNCVLSLKLFSVERVVHTGTRKIDRDKWNICSPKAGRACSPVQAEHGQELILGEPALNIAVAV